MKAFLFKRDSREFIAVCGSVVEAAAMFDKNLKAFDQPGITLEECRGLDLNEIRSNRIFDIDSGWMPIESAAKSAKSVIIHCPDRCNSYIAENGTGWWRVFGSWHKLTEEPTHWKYTPSPPDIHIRKQ